MREIICGISTHDKIEKFHDWITEKHLGNQDQFDNGVLSMDVEDVKVSYYDVMRMAGKIVISNPGTQTFKKRIDDRLVSGIKEDGWKQTLGKIMLGDSLTWTGIIEKQERRIFDKQNRSSTSFSRSFKRSSSVHRRGSKKRCSRD